MKRMGVRGMKGFCLIAMVATIAVLRGDARELAHESEVYGGLLDNLVARVRLWPDLAPGETNACSGCFAFDGRNKVWRRHDVSAPELMVFRPVSLKTNTLVLDLPGGGYMSQHMGVVPTFGRMTLNSGRFYAVLHYRIPRRPGSKIRRGQSLGNARRMGFWRNCAV